MLRVKEWRTLKLGVRVVQGHWKWRRSIDHNTTFYWSAIVFIALSGTVFELLDVEKYRDLEIWVEVTHSLTVALDQLRVVASSTSNDPGPRSRQHQQIGQCLLPLCYYVWVRGHSR